VKKRKVKKVSMIFGEEFPEFVQTPSEAAASIQVTHEILLMPIDGH
jgi:hypothetical protein